MNEGSALIGYSLRSLLEERKVRVLMLSKKSSCQTLFPNHPSIIDVRLSLLKINFENLTTTISTGRIPEEDESAPFQKFCILTTKFIVNIFDYNINK